MERWSENTNTVSQGLSHWYSNTICGLEIQDMCLDHIYGGLTHFEWTKTEHRGLRYEFLLDFLLCRILLRHRAKGLNRALFINKGHFIGQFLRGSAGMPYRFLEAKREGSGIFRGNPPTHIFVEPIVCCESIKTPKPKGYVDMWLCAISFVSLGELVLDAYICSVFGKFLVKRRAFGHFPE